MHTFFDDRWVGKIVSKRKPPPKSTSIRLSFCQPRNSCKLTHSIQSINLINLSNLRLWVFKRVAYVSGRRWHEETIKILKTYTHCEMLVEWNTFIPSKIKYDLPPIPRSPMTEPKKKDRRKKNEFRWAYNSKLISLCSFHSSLVFVLSQHL